MSEPLIKVDSAVQGLDFPVKEKRRASSAAAAGVLNIDELMKTRTTIQLAPETQRTGWKINSAPTSIEEKDILKKPLTTPPIKRIDIHFPYGMVVTARNLKGLTIKDAMDAIHKPNKKKADDELEKPYLEGFVWEAADLASKNEADLSPADIEEMEKEWTRLHVRLQSTPGATNVGGGKKKKNKGGDA